MFDFGFGERDVNAITDLDSLMLLKEAANNILIGKQIKKIQPFVERYNFANYNKMFEANGVGELLIGNFAYKGKTPCQILSDGLPYLYITNNNAPFSMVLYRGSVIFGDLEDILMFWGYRCQL